MQSHIEPDPCQPQAKFRAEMCEGSHVGERRRGRALHLGLHGRVK